MVKILRWGGCISLMLALFALIASCSGSNASDSSKGSSSGTVANGPRISIPEDSFDFGKVPLNKVVSHSFKIKNVGSAPLTIVGQPTVRAVQGC